MSLPPTAAPLSAVERLTLEDVPLAVVKHRGVRQGGLRELFDSSFGAIGAAVASGSVHPCGPAVAVYDGDPTGVFDLAIGLPVSTPLAAALDQGGVEIVGDRLPGGPYAALSHVGSYDGLAGAWQRLLEGVREAGVRPRGVWVEIYVTEPSPDADPAAMRTDLLVPIAVDEVG